MWLLWSLFNDKILLLLFIIFAIINYFCNNNYVLLCIFIGKLISIYMKVIYMVSSFVLLSFSNFRAWVPGFPCPWRLPLFATNTHWDLYRASPQSKVRKKIDSLMWIRDWEEKTGQKGRERVVMWEWLVDKRRWVINGERCIQKSKERKEGMKLVKIRTVKLVKKG